MRAAWTATLLTTAAVIVAGAAQRHAGGKPPARPIRIDSIRAEGHPCRPEDLIPPERVPPGAVEYAVDICVHHTVARTIRVRRPRSIRPVGEVRLPR